MLSLVYALEKFLARVGWGALAVMSAQSLPDGPPNSLDELFVSGKLEGREGSTEETNETGAESKKPEYLIASGRLDAEFS